MCNKTTHAIRTWFTLLRFPNLLTVPGDPLVGALLAIDAAHATVPWQMVFPCVLASLLLYSAGLLANDYFDREEDRRERPARPIPSGRATPGSVLASALLLTVAAWAFAAEAGARALQVALLLGILAWAYNAGLKRVAWIGPLAMGACRGLSLLLGAVATRADAVTAPQPLLAAGMTTLYIASVTGIARNETTTARTPGWALWLPATILLAGLATLFLFRWDTGFPVFAGGVQGLPLGLAAMAVVWVAVWGGMLAGQPGPAGVQKIVGGLIRGLILVQAALCASAGPAGEAVALGVLLAFPVAGWLGKWFYGS